ncbi:hypothetical protein CK203_092267 [Vitis vinifera]|uniref:Reverse transcriptase zinc-binding domain-containing protein n=1 Tax=Vitis vinifera TaxID=29760 RepID=A0A438F882_VITVI|nr:hypothetical protein CK203_092267 [Vitis vinifera]
MANAHSRRNQLNRIKVNERCLTEESEIKEEVGRNFQELLIDPGDWKPSTDGLIFERLEVRDVERLEKPFSEEEVFEALANYCGEKAPGPDDFSMAFWEEGVKGSRLHIYCLLMTRWCFVKLRGSVDTLVLVVNLVEALSGLKVNNGKSELIPVGRLKIMGELADEFGYKVGILPSTYLGMPLGAPFKSIGVWDGIEEIFKKRLAMWKRQYISKGGMITLIRTLICSNKALLGKWAWRFANEKKALWNQVIRRKYREEIGGWRSCEIREAYGVGDRRGSWTPTFNRPFNDWEMEEVGRLLCYLEGKRVRVDKEDRVRWVKSKDGVFSVKSLYKAPQPVSSALFPSKIIWRSCAQPKISFFAWEASWAEDYNEDIPIDDMDEMEELAEINDGETKNE